VVGLRKKNIDNIEKVFNYFLSDYKKNKAIQYFNQTKISREVGINPRSLKWILNFLVEKKLIIKELIGTHYYYSLNAKSFKR